MIERIIAASVRNRFLVFVFTLFAIVAGIYALKRTPLDAILAVENGIAIESVIALLTETISAQQLEMISALMDEKRIDGLELP